MPLTPEGAIPTPDAAGHTRMWEHFQALADRVEELLYPNRTTLALTAGTGWGSAAGSYVRFGHFVFLDLSIARTGAVITASSLGNITDETLLSGIPVAIRPRQDTGCTVYRRGFGMGGGRVQTDGTWVLSDYYPNANISQDTYTSTLAYSLET